MWQNKMKSNRNCGKNNPMYGKKHSKETRKKISESHKGKYNGENNPNWKGGISGNRYKVKIICKDCGKKFYAYNAEYCKKCRGIHQSTTLKGRMHTKETCEKIRKSKIGKKNPNWSGGKTKKKCKICGKIFLAYSWGRKYCNRACANKVMSERMPWNKGISPSLKTREKLRGALKGQKRSLETKIKLRQCKIGDRNPNWKGGVTSEYIKLRATAPYRDWRKSVYERDNYTCQKCGDNKGGNLTPHHIKNYAEYMKLRLDINNGITLCVKCHKRFHKRYGLRHNTNRQLMEFLNE